LGLKWWLKIVRDNGKDANWLKPNKLIHINKKADFQNEDTIGVLSAIMDATKGTIPKAKAVGIAVFRHTSVCLLSLTIAYLQKVPIANEKNIIESMTPKNNYPIPNCIFILCLLKE